MGQTLSEPVTTKETSSCQNTLVKVGASCMQGWRISILLARLCSLHICYRLPHYQMTHLTKMAESYPDGLKTLGENRWVENTGKRRNCSLRAISPFPTVFSKGLFPRGVKRCHCVGMG